jgi:hypothetical protein
MRLRRVGERQAMLDGEGGRMHWPLIVVAHEDNPWGAAMAGRGRRWRQPYGSIVPENEHRFAMLVGDDVSGPQNVGGRRRPTRIGAGADYRLLLGHAVRGPCIGRRWSAGHGEDDADERRGAERQHLQDRRRNMRSHDDSPGSGVQAASSEWLCSGVSAYTRVIRSRWAALMRHCAQVCLCHLSP